MNGEYEYEVAFSFLQDDEQLALEIANRIRDRVSVGVFVYSERHEDLVGTDGVDSFSRVFGEESRIVVILYREGWGQTKWTRVEENAIRARGFEQGHEFVVLVKLDPTNAPVWLPPTRIYLGFDRYGIDGVASVIEARVQAAGGIVHIESIANYAARISHDLNFESKRRQFLSSDAGVETAKSEVVVLFGELERLARQVNNGSEIQLAFHHPSFDFCRLSTRNARFGVTWHQQWANSLEYADYKQGLSYSVDLDRGGHVGWREGEGEKRFLTTTSLAEMWLKLLLEREHRRADRKS